MKFSKSLILFAVTALLGCEQLMTVNKEFRPWSYTQNPAKYTLGAQIQPNQPTLDAPLNPPTFSISPALPAGLTFDPATGVISGVSSELSTAKVFKVTAVNSAGTTTTEITLGVIDRLPVIEYSPDSYTFTQGEAIAPITPETDGGGKVTSCDITPALPTGLTFDYETGTISGTPLTLVLSATLFTVTAQNASGTGTATLSLRVLAQAPDFSYTPANPYFVHNSMSLAPTLVANKVPTLFSAAGLPDGLSINTSSGVISGSPTVLTKGTTVSITGTNSGGEKTVSFELVIEQGPFQVSYSSTDVSLTLGVAMTPMTPTVTGAASFPSLAAQGLPAGLTMSTRGVISGTPTALTVTDTNFNLSVQVTITASLPTQSVTLSLSIRVKDKPPAGLAYSTPSPIYYKGVTITHNVLSNTGGPIVTCTISPALPAGLSLNAQSCEISGTPSALATSTTYTATAINSGGSATAQLTLRVTDPQTASPIIFGVVQDATTGSAIAGASVVITAVAPGTSINTLTTDTRAPFDCPTMTVGSYTVYASKSGYITSATRTVTLIASSRTEVNFSLSPPLSTGEWRIVTSWCDERTGAVRDVDSYLLIPGVATPLAFPNANTDYEGSFLDVDDTTWVGPETITIKSLYTGTYKFYVNNYSDRTHTSALGNSSVYIAVYRNSALVKEYSVPAGTGITYEVFQIQNGTLVDMQRYNNNLPTY